MSDKRIDFSKLAIENEAKDELAYKELPGKKGKIDYGKYMTFFMRQSDKNPKRLIELYTQVESQEVKANIVINVGASHKDKCLILLLDYLYSKKLVKYDGIHNILKKYPLYGSIRLESSECDAIVFATLGYLDIPCPEINSSNDYGKYLDDLRDREVAARILAVLYKYPYTSEKTKGAMWLKSFLIVSYTLSDPATGVGIAYPDNLSEFLTGRKK